MIQESLEQNIDLIINLKDNIKGSLDRSKASIEALTDKLNNFESRWKEIAKSRTAEANKERRLLSFRMEQLQKQIASEKQLVNVTKDLSKAQEGVASATSRQSIAIDRNILLTSRGIKQTTAELKGMFEQSAKGSKAMEIALSKAYTGEGLTKHFEIQKAKELAYHNDMDKLRAFYGKKEQSQRVELLDRLSNTMNNRRKAEIKANKSMQSEMLKDAMMFNKLVVADKREATRQQIKADNEAKRNFSKTAEGAWTQGTTFGHKLVTTGQYMAAGTLLYGGATAALGVATKVAEATAQADLSARTMSAVLEVSLPKAQNLESEIRRLGETFGGSLDSIDQVALSLGRAGIAMNDIVPATKVVLGMARLTGDTFEESADAIISFQQVYGNTTAIETLGDKLAYVANVSRLSTKDIGTFANYALAASKSVGMTEDAVGGLAAAFSNAGVNASTIGTQIRRFTTLLTDDSEAVTNFFDTLGVNQKNLMSSLQKGGAESNKALMEFVDTLKSVDKTTFNNLVGQMDILAANSLQLMRNNSSNIDKFIKELQNGVKGQLDNTRVILESYTVTFESIFNTLINKAVEAGSRIGDALRGAMQSAQQGYYIAMETITGEKSAMYDTGLVDILKSLELQEKIVANMTEGQEDYAEAYARTVNLRRAASIGASSQVDALKEERKKLQADLEKAKKESLTPKDTTNPFALDRIEITPLEKIKKLKEDIAEIDEKTATLTPLIANDTAKVVKTKEQQYTEDLKILKAMEAQAKASKFTEKETEKYLKNVKGRITAFENAKDMDSVKFKESIKVDIDVLGRNIQALSATGRSVAKEIVQYNNQIDSAIATISDKATKQITENKDKLGVDLSTKLTSIMKGGNVIYDLANLKGTLKNDTDTDKINIISKLVQFEQSRMDIASKRMKIEATITNATNSANSKAEATEKKRLAEAKRAEELSNRLLQNTTTIKELEEQISGEKEVSLSKAESNFRIEAQLLPLAYERMLLAKGTTQEKEMEAKYQEALISYYKKSIVYMDKVARSQQEKKALEDDINVSLKSQINDEEVRLGIVNQAVNAEREKLAIKIQDLQLKYGNSPEVENAKRQLEYLNALSVKKKDLNTLAKEYEKELQDQESIGYSAAKAGLQSLESSMMDFFDMSSDGWMDWHSLASNVLQDIYKQLLQQLVIKQIVSGIAGGINNYFGGAGASTSATAINSSTVTTNADKLDMIFTKADGGYLPTQKFAAGGMISGGSGLKDDVYLGTIGGIKTFAMGGEFVTRKNSVNPNTQSTLEYINSTGKVPQTRPVINSPISIQVDNSTGMPIEASMIESMQQKNANGDYERVVNIILKASKSDPRVASLLKGK